MDVLVIGFSSIVLRRILPALSGMHLVSKIHVATMRQELAAEIPHGKRGLVITGYERAMDELPPCLCYISLPNHLHGRWVHEALRRGFHVVVDKPAFLRKSDFDAAIAAAKDKNLCLAEAVVWPFHQQINALLEKIEQRQWNVKAMHGAFSFPPLPAANFRNDPQRGGGAFADLAAYAITPGRIFYGESPEDISCRVVSTHDVTGVDTGFCFESYFSGGRSFQGFYSFNTEYRNSLLLLGDSFWAQVDPAFTMGPTSSATISIRAKNQPEAVNVPACDMFRDFLEAVISSIQSGTHGTWADILRQDAEVYFRAACISGVIECP